MTFRDVVSKELGVLLGVLSHPSRLRLVEELREGERDVKALSEALGLVHSSASQHLGVLRVHHVAVERREGRHVFYRLAHPELAEWLVAGLRFIEPSGENELRSAVGRARAVWSAGATAGPHATPRRAVARHTRRTRPS